MLAEEVALIKLQDQAKVEQVVEEQTEQVPMFVSLVFHQHYPVSQLPSHHLVVV